MQKTYHRTRYGRFFQFAGIEKSVRNFILDKAVEILQSLKSRALPKTFGDVESGLLDAPPVIPTAHRLQYYPGIPRNRSNLGVLGGNNIRGTIPPSNARIEQDIFQRSPSASSSSERSSKQENNQQPQFTDGPARFITANDGSKDCIALLVNDTLITKLRDLYEDNHHLAGKQGPLDVARTEAWEIENSISQIIESLEVGENQERIVQLKAMVRRHEQRLLDIQQCRDTLTKSARELEAKVASSKSHIQWVLHNAMERANLFEPHRPLTPNSICNVESEAGTEKDNHYDTDIGDLNVGDRVTNNMDKSAPHFKASDGPLEELQLVRQEAWISYKEAFVTKQKVQELFDDRQESYETDLADYQQGFKNGTYNISRSEFDRSKIRYGQKVTQALINAEAAFEAAKKQAQAVGALDSDDEDEAGYYGCYEESWPESQIASYLATKDWSHVSKWLARVLGLSKAEAPIQRTEPELERPEVVDWCADELDPADSISQVDFDKYRKDIDRWESIRYEQWEDMRTQVNGPETQVGFLVRNIESLKRRHSTSMCNSVARK